MWLILTVEIWELSNRERSVTETFITEETHEQKRKE